MGTQQLLLIVLGVVLVGLAVVLGITLINSHAVETNRQECIDRITQISDLAMSYYNKTPEQGGGGLSFDQFDPQDELEGEYNLGKVTISMQNETTSLTINARGIETGIDGTRPVIVRGIVDNSGLTIQIKN